MMKYNFSIAIGLPLLILFAGCNNIGMRDSLNGTETEESAITIVRDLPEVEEFFRTLEAAGAEARIDAEMGDGRWLVHVYEVKDGHTATFNWFTVDRVTGVTTKEFP